MARKSNTQRKAPVVAEEALANEIAEDLVADTSAEAKVESATSEWISVDEIQKRYKTKSAAIRFLATEYAEEGKNITGKIAKHLNLRYQHVRNVLTQELKRGARENINTTENDEE